MGQKLFLEPPNSHYLSKIELFKISMLSTKKNNNRKLYSTECADSGNVSVIIHVQETMLWKPAQPTNVDWGCSPTDGQTID